jgi:hypothetical protein
LTIAGTITKKIILEHNHTLAKSPSMIKQMGAHKMKEAIVDDMIDTMHKAKVSHVKVMEREVQNRYICCL